MRGIPVQIFLLGNVLYTLVKCCPLASQRMTGAITGSASHGRSTSGNTLSEFLKPVWEPKHGSKKQTLYSERKWKNPLAKQKNPYLQHLHVFHCLSFSRCYRNISLGKSSISLLLSEQVPPVLSWLMVA